MGPRINGVGVNGMISWVKESPEVVHWEQGKEGKVLLLSNMLKFFFILLTMIPSSALHTY